jgi:preprotein translocase subunit SecA
MVKTLLNKVFGSRHERERKRVQPIVDEINAHGEALRALSEAELQAQTAKFRAIIHERTDEIEQQIAELKERKRAARDPEEREAVDNELGGADGRGGLEARLRDVIRDTLDEVLPEAFATVREAARRLLGTTVSVTGPGPHVGHGALRCAAHRRHPVAPRPHRRNGDR